MKSQETIIHVGSTELEVKFVIRGKHLPATRLDPEEHPELEILEVHVQDLTIEVLELLSEEQVATICEKVLENLEE
jgi:hypothetical protein